MIVVAIIFILLGVLIRYCKWYFLIAGYNTMSDEEKQKYDIEGIAKLFRNVMFGMASMIILGYFIAKFFKSPNILECSFWISIIIGVPYLLIKSNSKRYRKN
ncbi:DUF3784 domain-containing protein [Constantimarinum furrinae]|uniref:DUF3784 domain-containing protein n=1 Tax=Constantimarinum furrinae TaxID=2562285 RepID=A0A7G8PTA2_9FLAO|nr:DUF3784 domain-containing protein [Constantimarinum furrinae]QNJ97568.1 hypothetical protein ALE3EI_0995 [Constantimarinum furrinae]